MLPIAYYLLKVIICSGILYAYYWLLLRNKVFHKYNRFYLMLSVVLSLTMPLIKITFWQPHAQQAAAVRVLQVVSYGDEYMDNITVSATPANSIDITQLYPFVYLLVSFILLIIFVHTLLVIFRLLKKYPAQSIDRISFINTDAKSTPFSFLNYIFWNHNIDMETTTGNQIFKHELAHVQEGHTYDKLFINIILIFFWCNPFYWLYRKELNMIHEFIADKKAVEDSDTEAFAAMILQATYPQHRFQLTNNFFYSPIKRRLLMLTKNSNPKVNYLGRIMVLPLLVLVFAAFTFKAKSSKHLYSGNKIAVIIDAGHGGKDGGAKSADGYLEKDLTLAIAKKIKELNTNDAIEIILLKETDVFITKEQKASFARENNAAIYISIHAGATSTAVEKEYTAGDPMNNKRGLKLLIGDNDFPYVSQSRILGSVILNEFSTNYQLPVSRELLQRSLYNLQNAPCPSVYIETGLFNNKKDLAFLRSAKGQENIATNILTAVEKFASTHLQPGSAVTESAAATTAYFTHTIMEPVQVNAVAPACVNMFVNVKNADTNYFKTDAYKTKALIIIDDKEIGYYGYNYVEQNNFKYSSIVIYAPAKAQKNYGDKGKYGVIKLTVEDAIFITADSIFYDNKIQTIKLSGNNSNIKGNTANTLIYLDGKIITPLQLNEINPQKIEAINILKGEKLDDIAEARGKTAVINISLKPEPLQEVVVMGRKTEPLYVIDTKIQENNFNLNSMAPDNIERVDVLKDKSALAKYGEKGQNGVVEITTKINPLKFNNPILTVGNLTRHTVSVADFKKQTQLNVTDGYSFVSATVYFSGKGFPQPQVVHLNGSSLQPLKNYINECVEGSSIVFDNVKVQKEGIGLIAIDGHAFQLADIVEINTNTYGQQPATTTRQKNTAGVQEVTVTGYPSTQNSEGSNLKAISVVGYAADRKFSDTTGVKIEEKVFTRVEIEPAYPGGFEGWKNYLVKKLDPTIPVNEGWKAGTYTVIVRFIVNADGSISDVTTTNYKGSKTAQHCIDLIKNGGKWSPAIQNGKKVNAYRKQPITFVIEAEKKTITELYKVPGIKLLISES
jgi:TonB-dependent SusC/RagA subfamily outer membrane receptor